MGDLELYIFARIKNDKREYYCGNLDWITDFHLAGAWQENYDKCIPFSLYDSLQTSYEMLSLIYDDYSFEFYKLHITKRDENEPLDASNVKIEPNTEHVDGTVRSNTD